jgi:hypothetical protein
MKMYKVKDCRKTEVNNWSQQQLKKDGRGRDSYELLKAGGWWG